MSLQRIARLAVLHAMCLVLGVGFPNVSLGKDAQKIITYDVVNSPPCANNMGETVSFIESSRAGTGIAAGMANRDRSGKPVVFRSNYAAAPPEFQSFIDRHECAHHQTGDVDRPHPPRNSADHLMNESISDCVAILRLRDEDGYNQAAFSRVANAMRDAMAKIGFPEISISSRISNIYNCYSKYGSPRDFVIGILRQRGLPNNIKNTWMP
jgi:hypothetical protein